MADKSPDSSQLERLFATIDSRRGADPESSYTAQLFAGGLGTIAQKVGEEAVEVVVAAHHTSPRHVTEESADLLYHLLVLWAEVGIKPADVWAELARREGTSGLDEKAARAAKQPE
jgi:phosphoribosyl-ATP pyrophosphohydrolase